MNIEQTLNYLNPGVIVEVHVDPQGCFTVKPRAPDADRAARLRGATDRFDINGYPLHG